MKSDFADILSRLRREKGLSQRGAAADLGVSQALLSHYENGAREPKLEFVVRACDYYGVTADFLLGRVGDNDEESARFDEAVEDIVGVLEGLKSLEATLATKLVQLKASKQ